MNHPVRQAEDADPAESRGSFDDRDMPGEDLDAFQSHVGAMRDHLDPVARLRSGDRRPHQAEVDRLVVGQHVEVVAVVFDRVLDPGPARLDQAKLAGRPMGIQEPDLRGRVAFQVQHQVALALGLVQVDEEGVVGFIEDQVVLAGIGPQHVALQAKGSV